MEVDDDLVVVAVETHVLEAFHGPPAAWGKDNRQVWRNTARPVIQLLLRDRPVLAVFFETDALRLVHQFQRDLVRRQIADPLGDFFHKIGVGLKARAIGCIAQNVDRCPFREIRSRMQIDHHGKAAV